MDFPDVIRHGYPDCVEEDGVIRAFTLLVDHNSRYMPTQSMLAYLYQRYDKKTVDTFLDESVPSALSRSAYSRLAPWLTPHFATALEATRVYLSYRILPRDVVRAVFGSGTAPNYDDAVRSLEDDLVDVRGKLVLIGPDYRSRSASGQANGREYHGGEGVMSAFGPLSLVTLEANILNMLLEDIYPRPSAWSHTELPDIVIILLVAAILYELLRQRRLFFIPVWLMLVVILLNTWIPIWNGAGFPTFCLAFGALVLFCLLHPVLTHLSAAIKWLRNKVKKPEPCK